MAMISVRCPVLDAYVTFMRNADGHIAQIFCAHYDRVTCECRFARRGRSLDDPSRLVSAANARLPERTKLCVLAAR